MTNIQTKKLLLRDIQPRLEARADGASLSPPRLQSVSRLWYHRPTFLWKHTCRATQSCADTISAGRSGPARTLQLRASIVSERSAWTHATSRAARSALLALRARKAAQYLLLDRIIRDSFHVTAAATTQVASTSNTKNSALGLLDDMFIHLLTDRLQLHLLLKGTLLGRLRVVPLFKRLSSEATSEGKPASPP